MTLRVPSMPLLPGLTFSNTLGQTRFHRSQHFEKIGSVAYLSDKSKPGIGGAPIPGKTNSRYPSVYARGEVTDLPAWIAFDRQILCFDAFFKETLQEMRTSPFTVRYCKIYFYLEDGTIKVTEPQVNNSGIPQGTLIARQRIPFPKPKDDIFYDILDFNIGKEAELFGKVFKLVNCDAFTRNFLNRCGIPVPDPINTPTDPYYVDRDKMMETFQAKKPSVKVDTFGQFLTHDRHVLRFYGYWDDRMTEDGTLHNLEIHYYLADDTMEITERLSSCNSEKTSMFIRRGKLPKYYTGLPSPGQDNPVTVLNVLGPGLQGGRYITDPLNCGLDPAEYYKQNDLAIGAAINVYGRKVVLTDCDPYTKEYYRVKYGLDNFCTVEKPKVEKTVISLPLHERKLPPWNGFGSFEDSAQNCITVEPKQIFRDFKKFLTLDRQGLDSRILRFQARMLSKIPQNCDRIFIISYYLCDDTISVHELGDKFSGSMFLKRGPIRMPGQEYFTSEPPDYYQSHHLYIGATVNFNGFIFILTNADEYALRFMELHCNEYPKSDAKKIIDKVREKLKPIYKDFVAENLPKEHSTIIPFEELRYKLCKIMAGGSWTEHEMITLARAFSAVCREKRHDRNYIRAIVLTELKKKLWDDLDRLREYFLFWDPDRTGFVTRAQAHTLLRGNRLPLDQDLIEHILDTVKKNDKCDIAYNDLFNFLDRNKCPLSDMVPMNIKYELWWASEPEPVAGKLIDWCAFNKALDLEKTFKEPVIVPEKKEGDDDKK